MKKFQLCLIGMLTTLPALAAGSSATIKTNPSPALSNKPLEVTIVTENFGSEVYCYTWCADINGEGKSPWQWGDVHTDKFRMSGDNGTYTITISSIKEFYGLSDNELTGLKKLGFIAKTSSGRQTDDLMVTVEQGQLSSYSGGSGTSSDPYILTTVSDLNKLADTPSDWGASSWFRLDADINGSTLNGVIGTVAYPFKGHFNGNGHVIKNISVSGSTVGEGVALFGAVDGATVTDLGVVNANVSGATYTGALVGYAKSGNIERCYSTGRVTGTSVCVGGLVGENFSATIKDCYSTATVDNSDDYATGGLIGKNSGRVINTFASGEVSGYDYAGGLVGANYGMISNSVALNGKITSASDFAARFGGNNNSRNTSDDNHSWDKIVPGHLAWTSHGDHAQSHDAASLVNYDKFKSMTGWDFTGVWEWRTSAGKNFPVLRNISSQECTLPSALYENVAAIDDIFSEKDCFITVGPNPTCDVVNVNSSTPLVNVMLYSLNGAVLAEVDAFGEQSVTVDMSSMTQGMYLLAVTDANSAKSIFKVIRK